MSSYNKLTLSAGLGIDIPGIARAIIKNLAYIIMIGIIIGTWSFIGLNYFAAPQYAGSASLVVIVNEDPGLNFRRAQMDLAIEQYAQAMQSDVFYELVANELPEDMKSEFSIYAEIPENSNVIQLSATGSSPEKAFMVISEAMKVYHNMSGYMGQGYKLQILSSPKVDTIRNQSTNVLLISVIIAVIGMLCSIMIVVLAHLFSGKIDNAEQARRKILAKYIGQVFFEQKKGGKKNKESLLITRPTVSRRFTTDIKRVSNRVENIMNQDKAKVLLVGSVLENEGKSTMSSNLAISLAQRGKKVLLLDLDVRKPSVAKVLDMELNDNQEITKILGNRRNSVQNIEYSEKYKFYYMLGSKVANDNKLMIIVDEFKKMIENVKSEFDYIIIDSSPICVSEDTQIIGTYADKMLLTIRQGAARTDLINDTVHELKNANIDILGYILNAVDTKVVRKRRK